MFSMHPRDACMCSFNSHRLHRRLRSQAFFNAIPEEPLIRIARDCVCGHLIVAEMKCFGCSSAI